MKIAHYTVTIDGNGHIRFVFRGEQLDSAHEPCSKNPAQSLGRQRRDLLTAAELSYVFLLASGAAEAERVPAAEMQIVLPIGAGIMQTAGSVSASPPPDPAGDDPAQTDPAESKPANSPPYIEPEPVIDASAQASDDDVDNAPELQDENIIIVTGSSEVPGDPLGGINIEAFEAARSVDKAIVTPIARAYEGVVPKPVRDGLNNFTNNLNEPINFINFLLQFKFGKAAETLGRFTINSTLGLGGIFDVAKSGTFNLPYRNNGFANTLGFYGVEQGPYLFLPVIGSTTIRDTVGDGLDALFLPNLIGKPFNRAAFSAPVTGVRALNRRVEFDERNADIIEESLDPYATNRDLYLKQRQTEINILRGRIPDPLSGSSIKCDDLNGSASNASPPENITSDMDEVVSGEAVICSR